jgi:hypothetical protein
MDDTIQRKSKRVYALAIILSVSVALFVSLIYSNSDGATLPEDLLSSKSSDLSVSFGTDNAADIQELKEGLGLVETPDKVVTDESDAPDSSNLVQGLGLEKDPDSSVSLSSDDIDYDSSGSIGAKAASSVDEFLNFNADLTAPAITPASASRATSKLEGGQGRSGIFPRTAHELVLASPTLSIHRV